MTKQKNVRGGKTTKNKKVEEVMKMEKITEDNKFIARKHWTSLQQLLMKKLI